MYEPGPPERLHPLVVLVGPTGSGKTALALRMAEEFGGEIVSCDAVAVYRGLDIGSAKPAAQERARIPHHGLDLLDPDEASTAGDYARAARSALAEIKGRGKLPIVTGGTGLYLRALLEGLAPAPQRNEALRARLRLRAERFGSGHLHTILRRIDPQAGAAIHPNDTAKLIRSLEVAVTGGRSQTEQWSAGREPLRGFQILQLGLHPARAELYDRINRRAAAMFSAGLLEETAAVREKFGEEARALTSLGYAQALAVLRGELSLPEAIAAAQQGHRNYAKRQITWFRRDKQVAWLSGFGDDPAVQTSAAELIRRELRL